jgi:hypothetical protein
VKRENLYKKNVAYLSAMTLIFLLIIISYGCQPGSASTIEGAAKTFFRAMIDADGGIIQKMNKSSELDFPTSHVIKTAEIYKIVGSNINDWEFIKANTTTVQVVNNKTKRVIQLHFMKMDGKFYFTTMDVGVLTQ